MFTAVLFNLFVAAEPSANVSIAHGTLCIDPSVFIATTAQNWSQISFQAISVCFGGTLAATRGTPVEKQWFTV